MEDLDKCRSMIVEKALKLGFDDVAFTSTALVKDVEDKFETWVNDGKNGNMEYLSKRIQNKVGLDDLLPGTKTIISLAVNYFQGDLLDEKPNPLQPRGSNGDYQNGRVARYAVTRDYHKIIGKKLKQLSIFLEENFTCKTKAYVDTGPILERAYASKAGLGYIGNNSCLISEKFGSWVFIAEILTDLQLADNVETATDRQVEPGLQKNSFSDNNVKISCGSCTRCIDLCPTQAINKDKTIDATKCISYLTIENKGAIPEELRDQLGNWIYGCDICQDVCPHNAKAKPTKVEEFKDIKIHNRRLALKEILAIKNDEEFLRIFAGTPLMRAKRRGLLRNACVVAGNSGNHSFLGLLENIAQNEPDEMLREHAKWAIQKITSSIKR